MDLQWEVTQRGLRDKYGMLRIGFVFVCLACVAQAVAISLIWNRPVKTTIVPGAKPGLYTLGEYTDDFVKSYADYFLAKYNNFTPATIAELYDVKSDSAFLVNYLAPEFLAKSKADLELNVLKARRDSLTSLFKASGIPDLAKTDKGYYLVSLTGRKNVLMGSQPTQDTELKYTLWIRESVPNKYNPYGLVVAGMKKEEVTF